MSSSSPNARRKKKNLAEEVTGAVTSTLHDDEEPVPVGIEKINSQDWNDKLYKPDILGKN